MQVQINIEDLRCPITHELIEDPINLPCCGRAISRLPLAEWKTHGSQCPLCFYDLSDFDAEAAPKAVNISYMIEHAKLTGTQLPIYVAPASIEKKTPKFTAKIHCLCNNTGLHQTVIGKLEIKSDVELNLKTLLIPVVDRSGSMRGNPAAQCRYSLNRIVDLTYQCKHLITNIIAYDDRAESTLINTSAYGADYYHSIVSKIDARGGTSFECAFNEIVKLCEAYKDRNDISSMVIVFLTDGGDGSPFRNSLDAWKTKLNTL